jgi:HEAT repeat protein
MKTRILVVVLWLVGVMALVAVSAEDEEGMIAVLQSPQATVEQKDGVCQKLRVSGSVRCVPALSGMLLDENLSHSGRLALERMAYPEAGRALREAMGKTSGKTKAGIIESLGERRDGQSVKALVGLMEDPDVTVASSAVAALGKIGGAEAIVALRSARVKAPAALRAGIVDALLAGADQLLASGDSDTALGIYKEIFNAEKAEHLRAAAYRGVILAAGADAAGYAVKGIVDGDGASLLAGLRVVRDIKGGAATAAFAAALARVKPPVQVALIEALAGRGDPAAASAVASLMQSDVAEVRMAAMAALGALGDASNAMVLAQIAANAAGKEQETARQALALLRDAKVRDVLLEALPKASPGVQGEIVRALGARQETSAAPALIEMARGNDEGTRMLALRSLTVLGEQSHAGELITLLLGARSDGEREAAEQAVVSACGRGGRAEAGVPRVLGAMKGASVASRAALLRVAGRLGGAEALAALRAAIGDADGAVQEAALRTMAEYGPVEAMDDLLKLANLQQRSDAQRVLALRGYWRLVGVASDRPIEERWRICEAGMGAARRAEEKRMGLSELSKVGHAGALKLAETLGADEAVRAEAEAACVRIASALAGSQREVARAALGRIAKEGKSDAVRVEARKALEAMDQYGGFITVWAVAGPFRQAGKQCAELFDISFAPEQAGAKVEWKRLAPPQDPALFWQADLLGVAGADQSVVYVKSRIWSPKPQTVRLEIGSDDGNRVWLNGKVVHAKNTMRPIQAGSDRAEAALNQGWNPMMIKVTQNNMGCAVCVRIRQTDGSPVEGLRFDDGLGEK